MLAGIFASQVTSVVDRGGRSKLIEPNASMSASFGRSWFVVQKSNPLPSFWSGRCSTLL